MRVRAMGGMNSGRRGRPYTVEDCLVIDLPLMMRRGWVAHGRIGSGRLEWTRDKAPIGSIGYSYNLADPRNAELRLYFRWGLVGDTPREVEQRLALTLTSPRYGGVRWWLRCPVTGRRATKLYKPPGAAKFAGRAALRLGYRSQREAPWIRPLEQVHRIQRRLGQQECWEMPLLRPKGMWNRTFERYAAKWRTLERFCNVECARLDALIARQ